jgi:ribonuclease P protein component
VAHLARLKNRAEFGRVIKRGRTVGDRNLVLFVLFNESFEQKVGFTAQRKAGNAVKRNRIKRRLRALQQYFEKDLVPCGDIIWLGKAGVLDARWDSLISSGRRLLTKAGCLVKA